jgi:hypothetical protein
MTGQGLGTREQGLGRPEDFHRFSGLTIILLAAAVATAPILLHGQFCGDDFEFHAGSWFDVQQSWRHGIAYPHWMQSANYNAGEPRFMFYPPLIWMLGAALGFVLPWPLVPVAIVFLCLAGTGFAVRALALEKLSDAQATLAGCAALFSGFALFTAYERTAFAELAGGFWIPLVLLFALRDRNPSAGLWRRTLDGSTLPLALLIAGCWISDGPVGMMVSYLLVAIAATASAMARSWAPLLRASIAAALGIALPAFYLIPAAWEQHWADLRAAADYPVFRIENNWLFARHTDALLAPFGMVLHRASVLCATMIGVAAVGMGIAMLRRRCMRGSHPLARQWWIPLALIPFVALFLQLPVSGALWNLLPKLRFLQYPWRWTLVVEAPMAIFLAAAIWPSQSSRRWPRILVVSVCAAAFLASAAVAGKAFLRVCQEGDTISDLRAQYDAGGGMEGTDEYEPADSDHWKLATGLPDACFTAESDATLGVVGEGSPTPAWRFEQGSCQAVVSFQHHDPEHIQLATNAPHAGYLILRLVSYPAWRIRVNGRPTEPTDPRDDGLIAVPVPQGPIDLAIDWTTTPDVTAGRSVSVAAILLLIALGWLERKPDSLGQWKKS